MRVLVTGASGQLVRAYHHTYGLNVVTTNCSNNYGPRQHPEKLIPLAITRMARGEPIPIYGDGLNIRDWLDAEDHCSTMEAVMLEGISGETYCGVANIKQTNIALLDLLCDLVDQLLSRPRSTSQKLESFVKDRADYNNRYAIYATKIYNKLGWSLETSFEDGLARTVRYMLGLRAVRLGHEPT